MAFFEIACNTYGRLPLGRGALRLGDVLLPDPNRRVDAQLQSREKMSLIPSPDDLLAQLALWLGLPTVVVVAYMTIMTAVDWFRRLASAATVGRSAGRSVLQLVVERTPSTFRRLIALAVSQGILLALTYSISKLALVTLDRGLDQGSFYVTGDVVDAVITYDAWSPWSQRAVLLVACCLALLNMGALSQNPGMRFVGSLPLHPLKVATLGLGVLAMLPGVLVFIMGAFHSSGYTVDMSYLYGLWVALLLGWSRFADIAMAASEGLARDLLTTG